MSLNLNWRNRSLWYTVHPLHLELHSFWRSLGDVLSRKRLSGYRALCLPREFILERHRNHDTGDCRVVTRLDKVAVTAAQSQQQPSIVTDVNDVDYLKWVSTLGSGNQVSLLSSFPWSRQTNQLSFLVLFLQVSKSIWQVTRYILTRMQRIWKSFSLLLTKAKTFRL